MHGVKDKTYKDCGELLIKACLLPHRLGVYSEAECFYVLTPERHKELHQFVTYNTKNPT